MLFGVPILDIKIQILMESDLDTGRSPSPQKKGLFCKTVFASWDFWGFSISFPLKKPFLREPKR